MVTVTDMDARAGPVMDQMPYGLYIVGSMDAEGEPNGMMADWVMQVSFEPRMVAVALEQDARTLANIRATKRFTVSMLPEDEDGMKLAARFAQPYYGSKVAGRTAAERKTLHHKMEAVPHFSSPNGCPVPTGSLSWVECDAQRFIGIGDHTLVVGRVVAGEVIREETPLTSLYSGWTYSG